MMTGTRVFYVVLFDDEMTQKTLDAIRFVCSPQVKHRAHITVRGPYRRRYQFSTSTKELSKTEIEIDGPGAFFENQQNTVFLSCRSSALRDAWFKPDFDYAPHVTLYDGDSRSFAERLLRIARRVHVKRSVRPSDLLPLTSPAKQSGFGLQLDLTDADLSEVFGQPLTLAGIETLDDNERLHLAEIGLRRLAV
jgi:hypothetical protein